MTISLAVSFQGLEAPAAPNSVFSRFSPASSSEGGTTSKVGMMPSLRPPSAVKPIIAAPPCKLGGGIVGGCERLLGAVGKLPQTKARIPPCADAIEVAVVQEDVFRIFLGELLKFIFLPLLPDDRTHLPRRVQKISGRASAAAEVRHLGDRAVRVGNGMVDIEEKLPIIAVGREA